MPPSRCWADYHEQFEFGTAEWARHYLAPSATCMLPASHAGRHEWTHDDKVIVRFPVREKP